MTISAAVSNGHARPTGLNGSCRLSAPAATLTPAVAQRAAPRSARAASPAGGRGPGGTGWSAGGRPRRCRPRRRRSAIARWRVGGCMPRLTQWLAVTGCGEPGRRRRRRRGRRARRPSGRASRRCAGRRRRRARRRSRGRSRSPAACRAVSRCGQPPTRSAPAASASRSSARCVGAGGAGRPASRTGRRSRRRSRRRPGGAPRPAPRCCAARGPASCRRGCARRVKPLAAISRAARSARSIVSATSSRWRLADHRLDRARAGRRSG